MFLLEQSAYRSQGMREYSEATAARRPDVVTRKRDGFVRECHGDMHLGNMIRLDDVVIFDCIEFNENFRWIDVASEVAFLVMDLDDRGCPDLAHRFLNGYLEATGDYGLLALLPFYLVYRATVRAKVAGIRLGQHELPPEEAEHLWEGFGSYLDLAERYTRPPRPRLMITHGVSGRGKTYGTQQLIEATGAIRLRSDVERKRLFSLAPLERSTGRRNLDLYTLVVAAQAGVPVVPLAIRGTRSMLRANQWFPRRGAVRLTIGAPLTPQGTDWAAARRL